MTLPRAYAPMLPEFDAFLFASVGEEVDGVPLSVLSALSQLGLDPRDEAGRLAHLPREAAADQLARMIAGLYDRRWSASEACRIASGLVERLPVASTAAKDDRAARGTRSGRSTQPDRNRWVLPRSFRRNHHRTLFDRWLSRRVTIDLRSSSFLVYMAMALAMLVGLIASGYLSFGA